jgi:hypothetical protein
MGVRIDWRSNRLRRSPKCSSEMESRTVTSSRGLIAVAGGSWPRFHAETAGGCRWVTQLAERCPDVPATGEWTTTGELARKGAFPLALAAPAEADATGANFFGRRRRPPRATPLVSISMISYGRQNDLANDIIW